MNDDRLSAGLRGLDAAVEPRPDFVAALHDDLASRLGLLEPDVAKLGATPGGPRPASAHRVRLVRRLALIAAVAALVAATVANAALIGSVVDRLVHPPSLLDTIRHDGAVTIAVRPNSPQALAPSGLLGGFDVDVARDVARRLGVSADLQLLEPGEILGGKGEWQVALASGPVPADDVAGFFATVPYYRWPSYVVARAGDDAAELDGRTVCVVADSAGQSWLDGTTGTSGRIALVPAPRATPRVLADDAACVADVLAGGSAAMVTSTILRTDVETNPGLTVVGSAPVVVEDRAILVRANQAGAAALRDELDRILDAMLADGTLADLARSRFGGEDVTAPNP